MSKDDGSSGISACGPEKFDQSAYAEAALILTESLIHGLCEMTVLSTKDAVDIVDRAVSVQLERSAENGDLDPSRNQSHTLLDRISNSLKVDLNNAPFTLKPSF